MKTILTFLLLTSSVFAGHSVCFRVSENCDGGSCSYGYGTGVVLSQGKAGIWSASTAAHVIGKADASRVSVFLDGRWQPVNSVYRLETDDDAAFVTFRYDGKLETTATIADDADIPAGEEVTFSGFSGGKTFERSTGRVTTTGMAIVDDPPKGGQSGGGVYRKRDGALIGILTGYNPANPHEMIYAPCGRCRRQCRRQWGMWFGVCIGPVRQPVQPMPPAQQPLEPSEQPAPPPPADVIGIPGPPGEQGPAGPPGRDGNSADLRALQLRIDELTIQLQTLRNTKIPVQILKPDGTIHDQATYTLGSPIKLKLAPK